MRIRSFFVTPLSLLAFFVASLSGCEHLDQRQMINFASAVGGSVVCYKLVGGGNMRLVSGAACGVGSYFLADWIQGGMADRQEAQRVQDEYQRALGFTPSHKRGAPPYTITTSTREGTVQIVLTIFAIEVVGPSTQCRSFNEQTMLNGVLRGQQSRRACRELINGQYKEWHIFSA